MQKYLSLTVTVILALLSFTNAQVPDYETFRRQQEEGMRKMASERDSIISKMNQDFTSYVEQRNREYAEYLEQEWERWQVFTGAKPEPGPKPDEMPAFDPQDQKPADREPVVINAIAPEDAQVKPREQFREPILVKPAAPSASSVPMVRFDFYGRELAVAVHRSFRGIRPTGTSEKDVSEWFNQVSATNFTPTMADLLDMADEMGMNDWALFMATRNLANKLANNNETGARLYTWFILSQAGYDIRLGRQQQQLTFMLPFAHVVYNTPRLTIDEKTFYLFEGINGEPVFTYNQNMPGAFRDFDMNFYKSPTFALQAKPKTISFEYVGNEYNINLNYDPVLVAMLARQPQAHMSVYLDADASNYVIQATQNALEPILEPMSNLQKVEFLLKLSQTAFEYQTDIDQFGIQKYMVPDEVIHYANSDCDDRAVIFGWLVRNYAGEKVAALLYPGHLANAVNFANGNPDGDYVVIDGEKYIVADPTYINAPIGLTMPDFANVAPTAWIIDTRRYIYDQNLVAWQNLMELGARRGNNQNDMAFTETGNVFATGYFSNSLQHPQSRKRLENAGEKRTAFVGLFDKDMKPQWLHAFDSEQDATGSSLILAPNGNIIVGGTFSGSLSIQGHTITAPTGQTDAFVASFRSGGQLEWIAGAGINNQHSDQAMSYSLHLTLDGQPQGLHYYNDPRETANGLFADASKGIVFTGTFGNTSGLIVDEAPVSASGTSMNYADLLLEKNKELIQQRNIESTIAGLFAAIYLSKSEGTVFPGSAAQEALRKGNPRFPSQFPETFANIGKISFLRNKSGIIEIKTQNGEDVFFDKMRIRNGSTMRVRTLSGGDEQIDILSNIHVGQMIVWYPLNFIRLNRRSGDLLFDYRSNNSQVTLNLKKDILN
jgi:hypothetical protein